MCVAKFPSPPHFQGCSSHGYIKKGGATLVARDRNIPQALGVVGNGARFGVKRGLYLAVKALAREGGIEPVVVVALDLGVPREGGAEGREIPLANNVPCFCSVKWRSGRLQETDWRGSGWTAMRGLGERAQRGSQSRLSGRCLAFGGSWALICCKVKQPRSRVSSDDWLDSALKTRTHPISPRWLSRDCMVENRM